MFPDLVPPLGMIYQWNTFEVLGAVDDQALAELAASSWTRVPRSRHPEAKSTHQDYIVIGGLILVERSEEVHLDAMRRDQKKADDAYNAGAARLEAAAGLKSGTIPRKDLVANVRLPKQR